MIEVETFQPDLVYRARSDLVEVVPFRRYRLPEHCLESSFRVFVNGQALSDSDGPIGYTLISSDEFELTLDIDPSWNLFVSYMKA